MLAVGVLAAALALPVYLAAILWYSETKGPYKNLTQVVDLEGDGDLDVLVSHTRWEAQDTSWAGVGRWVNQGDGRFSRVAEDGAEYFAGYAGGAADVDLDGDEDVFVQNATVRLLQNQGGLQGGQTGEFLSSGGMDAPQGYVNYGYRDMGGSIVMGDLNGDGLPDAFVAGCCYGQEATPAGGFPHDPSISWVWINDGRQDFSQEGRSLPLPALDGRAVRQAALGDLDGDGDLDVYAAVGKPAMGVAEDIDDLILLNDGAGNLSVYAQGLGVSDSRAVALGDVNGDGRLDALVGAGDAARLWLNQGGGATALFAPSGQAFDTPQPLPGKLAGGVSSLAEQLGWYLSYGSRQTQGAFLADLDGDGDLDALLDHTWQAELWWNDGRGAFTRAGAPLEHGQDAGVAVGDFDRDGDADVFIGNNGDAVQVWFNDGRGGFR